MFPQNLFLDIPMSMFLFYSKGIAFHVVPFNFDQDLRNTYQAISNNAYLFDYFFLELRCMYNFLGVTIMIESCRCLSCVFVI